jgi:hypothetical protein
MKGKQKNNHASRVVPRMDGSQELGNLLEFFTLLSRLDKAQADKVEKPA